MSERDGDRVTLVEALLSGRIFWIELSEDDLTSHDDTGRCFMHWIIYQAPTPDTKVSV